MPAMMTGAGKRGKEKRSLLLMLGVIRDRVISIHRGRGGASSLQRL